jgi:ATP-binding cassette subfamily C protein
VLPLLVLITLAFIRLMPNLSMLLMSINQLKFLSYAKNSILQELKSIEPEKLKIDSKKTQINITFNKSIKIENLDFKYNKNSSEYILKNINLDINLGEKIAIVGESGAGKSTLVNILTGLLRPESGRILVDGISVFESLKQWQNIISYIPQEIYLIDDTIEKNITFSTDKESYDKVWLDDVLRISNIYEEIYSLKDNVNTLVGNRGIRFSGGQKQRIAIARAIYKKPKILIMDEPASGLDSENELSLIENILSQSKKITLVMISHNIGRHKEKFQVYKLKNKSIIKEI